ncbi:hypothetical protein DPMN_123958 [Dreissena polymorpha]|uniref:Peptidase M12B domain-containing protein n=2 Tax=Dreissena polymorpha TaxID=45954 RepID=A0A9D4JRR8_DREPO|nr:hypothetical protein DPMN_123958 [Dreissena polymorpha]
MCRRSKFTNGEHVSINKLTADIVPTMAHELGHAFGMGHDGISNPCQNFTFLMANGGFDATMGNAATYRAFSDCSSKYLQDYTNGIGDDFRATCLMPPTATFNASSCLGFPGQIKTLDQQCKLAFGARSTRCTPEDVKGAQNESFLKNGYVVHCVMDNDKISPFYCMDPKTKKCSAIPDVMMGTRCLINGEMNQNNRCYQGVCKSVKLCDAPTTSDRRLQREEQPQTP